MAELHRSVATLRISGAEYSGDLIPKAAVAECVRQAHALQKLVIAWLEKNKPDLLE